MTHSTQTTTPTRQFSVRLSPTRRGARLARLLAVQQLHSWGYDADVAAQVIAELAANAATHGRITGRDFRLTLTTADPTSAAARPTLRIEVTDTRSDRVPGLRQAAPDDESGRGLFLVDALSDRWGVTAGPFPGKTVWAELGLVPG